MKFITKSIVVAIPDRVLIATFKRTYKGTTKRTPISLPETFAVRLRNDVDVRLKIYVNNTYKAQSKYCWYEEQYDYKLCKYVNVVRFPEIIPFNINVIIGSRTENEELQKIYDLSIALQSGKLFMEMIKSNNWNKAHIVYREAKQ